MAPKKRQAEQQHEKVGSPPAPKRGRPRKNQDSGDGKTQAGLSFPSAAPKDRSCLGAAGCSCFVFRIVLISSCSSLHLHQHCVFFSNSFAFAGIGIRFDMMMMMVMMMIMMINDMIATM